MLGRPEGWGRGGGGPGQLPGVQRAGRAGGAKRRSETQLQSMVELALQRGQTDRRMRTGWSRRERQMGVMGAGTAPPPRSQPAWCPRPLPPTSRPACLLQRAPPLPAGPPGSRSLSRPCALSFPPSQSSRQPPLPLRPIMNQGLPASLLAPHSLTHSHSLAPAARPPRTVSAAVSPSLASRQTSQGPSLRLWVSLCLSLWLPQVSPTANLLAPPRPSRLTPGLLHPAPTLPGALICRPRAGQHRAGGCPDDRLGGAGPAPARPALRLTTPQSGPPAPA